MSEANETGATHPPTKQRESPANGRPPPPRRRPPGGVRGAAPAAPAYGGCGAAAGRPGRGARGAGGDGEIWIVEIKSSIADFRADQKWMDYRMHCDRLFFATTVEVPCEIFPPDTGLIVADAFGAQIVCEAPEHRLHASTRKSMMLGIARAAALRLQSLIDPTGPYAGEV